MHVEQRRARLDLVGRATSDGAVHVLSCGYQGPYPHTRSHYENIDLAMMSQGFAFVYSDVELEDIEKEVAPLA